jgi:hypothetical protein
MVVLEPLLPLGGGGERDLRKVVEGHVRRLTGAGEGGPVRLVDMSEDTVIWSMTCGACDHEWMVTTPADSTPAAEAVECPECASSLLDADYAGRG